MGRPLTPADLMLDELSRAAGCDAPPAQTAGRLAAFAQIARVWAARTDLTSAADPGTLAQVLFLDALVLARPELIPPKSSLVDVGAGVGAPGLPLAILREDLEVTLVEPRRRRVAFLRTAVGSLALVDRVRVEEGRVEEGAPRTGRRYDVALSRATFPPDDWLRVGRTLAGTVLVLTAAADPPAPPSGCALVTTVRYTVPGTGAPRAITRYDG